MNTVISGYGHAIPLNIIDNNNIVNHMNTSEEFIINRTGILTRRYISEDQGNFSLMPKACIDAIKKANLVPDDIDLLIVNTMSPDHHDPSQACLIQPMIGLGNIPAFDIRAQCSGLVYGMSIAKQFIAAGTYKHVLLCCGEIMSKRMDCSDDGRNFAVLVGDGAGAVVLSAEEEKDDKKGILDIILKADGNQYKLLWTEAPGSACKTYNDPEACHELRMNGRGMNNHGIEQLKNISQEIILKNGLTINDIDIIISHQPNMRMLESVLEGIGVSEDKMWINVDRLGNMASASLPICLSEYMNNVPSELRKDKLALIVGYGSGATWGAALYKF